MFTKSENIKEEYSAQIVRIGKLEPIENSDFLAKTMINDAYQVVVGKNDVKEGQIMVYCKLETAINSEFLSVNNQFELGERQLNKNFEEVDRLIAEGKTDEAKKLVGYFNKHGRVRIVKLRGCASEGCLFTIDSIAKWIPGVKDVDFEQYITVDDNGNVIPFNFDTIGGKLFLEAYVPKTNEPSGRRSRTTKGQKKIARFDRMVEGQMRLHYDTNQLKDNMWRFSPDTSITASVKIHGTSVIIANLLVKKPVDIFFMKKWANKRADKEIAYLKSHRGRTYWERENSLKRIKRLAESKYPDYRVDYGNITASRTVIKNQYINKNVGQGYYSKDVWSEYGDLLYPYIPKGVTVYGEIAGYVSGCQSMIQKGYDYGCKIGENFIMPYRMTFTDNDGNVTEWSVQEVYGWTVNLLKEHPELESKVRPITILYHGTLGDLYPDADKECHWNATILERMKEDVEHFGMEKNEPMCNSKVPREGIVIRIDNDVRSEAFKLKCQNFLYKEAKEIDAGNVDIEMDAVYSQN